MTDQAGCIRFENCNLSQCKLSGHNPGYHHSFRRTEATACCFDKADLHGLDLNAAKFAGSSFCKANLKECTLRNADLTNCDLTGANLVFTELCHVNLTSANLTRTDLRDANLVDAVLSGATIDGANFKNAQVAGVDLSTLDTAKAKGLDEAAANVQIGQAGAKVQELEQAAQVASHLTSSIVITTQKEELTAIVGTYGSGSLVFYWVRAHQDLPRLHSNARTLEQAMTDIARHFSRGELQVDSVTAKGIKAPLKGKQLKMLCLAAWCEVFGREMPTDEELKEASAAKREGEQEIKQEMLDELRGGTKGVQRWNARSRQERQQAGHFNKVDLKGAKLANIDLKGMEFQQADFTGAKLKKADLGTADLKKAIFAHVDATGASFTGAKLNDADFQKATLMKCSFARANLLRTMFGGANLTGAKFGYANLSGADFTDAKLADVNFESTRFDEKTSFPEGFGLPEGLIWSGQGNDPRVAEKIKQVKSAGPVDFDAFMEQLEANFDASRLKKAMSMLKADSFQLFADVQSDSITGVVKSQTDADLVYSCRLDAEGTFACCTQNLNPCGGLRGALCKHLLVLIVGLTKGEELDPTTVNSWVAASKLQGPKLDKDLMSEVFLRYKGAEAGEIDWRPTETVPEDYYA
ncbi:MAG: pentapeptide repeat-containing protein, partial [Planctomycetaceae bacterium]|nr:pentapeptide repeat-containing protein [Planctomycetaceae bacterium]